MSRISLKTRLAATLCHMLRPDETGALVPVIDHESAKNMTEDQVLSIFQFDHWPIPKHRQGPDAHWNLTPRPIIEHRRKSATFDTPAAAKDDRIQEKQAEFRHKMLAKTGAVDVAPTKRPKSPMPGSRHHPSGLRKRMSGKVERW